MRHTLIKRKIFYIVCLICLLGLPVSLHGKPGRTATDYYKHLAPDELFSKTVKNIIRELQEKHYRKITIDDRLSSKILDQYLEDLDPTRSYFLASDIAGFTALREKLDDALLSGDLAPAFDVFNRYQQRVIAQYIFLLDRLENGLDSMKFDTDEQLQIDREDASWPEDEEALHDLWRRRLKGSILSLKLADKTLKETADILAKRYRQRLNRMGQTTSEDVFQIFINTFAQCYDPHTYYLAPRVYENFNISMSLSLEGIGAVLQIENEYTKVVRLVPAGPADKSNLLNPADRIAGVGQGADGEIVDVVGWRIDDVVELIRGPKGTIVRLEIVPAAAADEHERKVISITRDKVKLEEQAASKKVIELEKNGRTYTVGVIEVPTFYLDFKALNAGRSDYKSSVRDIRRLLKELADQKVDALIMDLRNNSGGALQEANLLVGLFIPHGPTVQVRNAGGNVNILGDPDPQMYYDGPLAVLVNRLSASASEIFAGAIQDYRRGIIIGEQTFGKGTVQTLIPLSHGQMKATIAKFYRVSGGSVQNRGIMPDVFYPSLYNAQKIGERTSPEALPWDEIAAAPFAAGADLSSIVERLHLRHERRIKDDPDYAYLLAMIDHIKKTDEKEYMSLNEAVRRKEREEVKQWRLAAENKRRTAKGMEPLEKLSDPTDENGEDTDQNSDADTDEDDPSLTEAGHILLDYIGLL